MFHCAIVWGKEAVFVVVVGDGHLSVFVWWVVGFYFSVSIYWSISRRLFLILYIVESLVSVLLCSIVLARREQRPR